MTKNVAINPLGTIFRDSFPEKRGNNTYSNAGEMRADDLARTTISPTATGTSPRAISVKGGPYGSPRRLISLSIVITIFKQTDVQLANDKQQDI